MNIDLYYYINFYDLFYDLFNDLSDNKLQEYQEQQNNKNKVYYFLQIANNRYQLNFNILKDKCELSDNHIKFVFYRSFGNTSEIYEFIYDRTISNFVF